MPALPHLRPTLAVGQRGVSLIELLVGIAIIGIAVAIGAPSFAEWINNSQIRSTAESLQNGLQFARAEAVRRNTIVRLQVTTTLDGACALSTAGTSWVVSLDSAGSSANHCGDDISETGSSILQKGQPVTAKSKTTINASQTAFGFNGLGRIVKTTSPDTDIVSSTIDINSSGGACTGDPGGTLRCLRVVVAAGGQIRMCDRARATPDPMACP
ncbi:type IV fimbrial biogenesis protein FimT [Variovorax sp. EL159]|nr:type IV fimbrial biogenesis protein FimT [Variovorax sp. EL159]